MFRHIWIHYLDIDVSAQYKFSVSLLPASHYFEREIIILYYVSLRPEDISDGRVQDTSGDVIYKVKFKALVFRPFRGEVIDGVVAEVSNNGIIIQSGPLHSFISTLVSIMI